MDLRPTGDRLKEALFNILAPDLPDAVLIDAFSGTGAIGIEALSRGAAEVVFVDRDSISERLIQQNLRACGIESGYRIVREDVFTTLRALARGESGVNIIFFDPPYAWEHYRDLLKLAFKPELLAPGALVVIEHGRKASLPESGDGFRRYRVVRQGDNCLSFYRSSSGSDE